ncbi:MAG: XTP/dITP diphosphatase [Clostridia bacterium]|nr:XTP/dITP diphosphatase [Clostridia bacterium]
MRLVLATNNKGKVKELKEMLAELPIEISSLEDYPELGEIEENGTTFEENALIKARAVAQHTGLPAMADDSGLEVDFLNGAPGVYSARFAGEPKSDEANNAKLLRELAGVPEENRSARFRCVIALVHPDGREYTAHGTCEGRITFEPSGSGGFGYDPLFYVAEFDKTFAQLDSTSKNTISHRGRALKDAIKILKNML